MEQTEIRSFLEKYAAGQHAEEDHQRFIDWLKTAPIKEVEQLMDEFDSIPHQLQLQTGDKDAQLVLQIEKAIDQYELGKNASIHQRNKFVAWRFMYRSAAAILVISLAGYLLFSVRQKDDNPGLAIVPSQTVNNEALPGGNKARLTLGDGSIVSLDDAGNGEIALQGTTQITKLTNGQLVYSSA